MKVLLEIPTTKQTWAWSTTKPCVCKKNASPISAQKYILMKEIKEAVEELNLIKAGKKTARNAEDFLNEL